jgi:hypothetical protein
LEGPFNYRASIRAFSGGPIRRRSSHGRLGHGRERGRDLLALLGEHRLMPQCLRPAPARSQVGISKRRAIQGRDDWASTECSGVQDIEVYIVLWSFRGPVGPRQPLDRHPTDARSDARAPAASFLCCGSDFNLGRVLWGLAGRSPPTKSHSTRRREAEAHGFATRAFGVGT